MAKHTDTTVPAHLIDAAIADFEAAGKMYPRLTKINATTIGLSGGSNGDRDQAIEHIARFVRRQRGNRATEKQLAFLSNLIHRDPGMAMTIGASRDGVRPVDGLTKTQASTMIENLR